MKKFILALSLVVAAPQAFAGSGITISCPACSYERQFIVGGGMMPFHIYSTHGVFFCDASKEFIGLAVFQDAAWGPVMEEAAALPNADEEGLASALSAMTEEDRKMHPGRAEFLEWYGRSGWDKEGRQAMTFGKLREALAHVAVAPVKPGDSWHSAGCEGALSPLADYEKPEAVCPVCDKGPVNVRDSGLMWD